MKYLRLKSNIIYKIISEAKEDFVKNYDIAMLVEDNGHRKFYIGKNELEGSRQADTLEELIDTYIVIPKNGEVYIECKKWDIYDYKEIYGAILIIGEHGEPILKSIAKMNNEGELELL